MSEMDPRDSEKRQRPGTETRELRLHASPAARARLIETGAALLRTQFRLWEHDLADPHQPLLDYGFSMVPERSGLSGKICRFEASDGTNTIIYGDAIVHGHAGHPALELERATFSQRVVEILEHSVTPAPADIAAEPDLLPHLLAWIGSYERWMADRFEDGERHRLIGLTGAAAEYPSRWWDLASQWRTIHAREDEQPEK